MPIQGCSRRYAAGNCANITNDDTDALAVAGIGGEKGGGEVSSYAALMPHLPPPPPVVPIRPQDAVGTYSKCVAKGERLVVVYWGRDAKWYEDQYVQGIEAASDTHECNSVRDSYRNADEYLTQLIRDGFSWQSMPTFRQCVGCRRRAVVTKMIGANCQRCSESVQAAHVGPAIIEHLPPGYALTLFSDVKVDTRPVVTKWSLHTLGGNPVLKLECLGGRYYKRGEVVSHDDFQGWEECKIVERGGAIPHQFRGSVSVAYTDLQPGNVLIQRFEVAVEHHQAITSGAYRQRGVMQSGERIRASIPARPVAPSPPQIAPPRKTRMFDLED